MFLRQENTMDNTEQESGTNKTLITICTIAAVGIVTAVLWSFVTMYIEIDDAAYAATVKNINKYPTDERLFRRVDDAMLDGEMTGHESKSIAQYIQNKYKRFEDADDNVDHKGAKDQLIEMLAK